MSLANYSKMWSRLGLLSMCVPLLSIVQGRVGVDLVPSLNDFLDFYRRISDAVLEVLYFPPRLLFRVEPGRLARDLHAISFMGMTLYFHSKAALRQYREEGGSYWGEGAPDESPQAAGPIQRVVQTYVGGMLFLGLPWVAITAFLIMPIYFVSVALSHWRGREGQLPPPANESIAQMDILARQGFVVILAVIAFFAWTWIDRLA